MVVSAAQGALGSGPITFSGPASKLGFEGINQTVSNNISVDTTVTDGKNRSEKADAGISVAAGISVTLTGAVSGGTIDKIGSGSLRLNGPILSVDCIQGTVYVNGSATDSTTDGVFGGTLGG